MKLIIKSIIILMAGFLFAGPSIASTDNCEVKGFILKTYGGISCAEAKKIYKTYVGHRHLPKGWVCGASAKECSNENGSMGFNFRLK